MQRLRAIVRRSSHSDLLLNLEYVWQETTKEVLQRPSPFQYVGRPFLARGTTLLHMPRYQFFQII